MIINNIEKFMYLLSELETEINFQTKKIPSQNMPRGTGGLEWV